MKSWADHCSDSDSDGDEHHHPHRRGRAGRGPAAPVSFHASSSEDEEADVVGSTDATAANNNAPPSRTTYELGDLPPGPPYTAFIGNFPYSVRNPDDLVREVLSLLETARGGGGGDEGEGVSPDIIAGARIGTDRASGKSKGYGYVEFATGEMLIEFLHAARSDAMIVGGRAVRVAVAQPQRRQTDGGGGGGGRGGGPGRGGRGGSSRGGGGGGGGRGGRGGPRLSRGSSSNLSGSLDDIDGSKFRRGGGGGGAAVAGEVLIVVLTAPRALALASLSQVVVEVEVEVETAPQCRDGRSCWHLERSRPSRTVLADRRRRPLPFLGMPSLVIRLRGRLSGNNGPRPLPLPPQRQAKMILHLLVPRKEMAGESSRIRMRN